MAGWICNGRAAIDFAQQALLRGVIAAVLMGELTKLRREHKQQAQQHRAKGLTRCIAVQKHWRRHQPGTLGIFRSIISEPKLVYTCIVGAYASPPRTQAHK